MLSPLAQSSCSYCSMYVPDMLLFLSDSAASK